MYNLYYQIKSNQINVIVNIKRCNVLQHVFSMDLGTEDPHRDPGAQAADHK